LLQSCTSLNGSSGSSRRSSKGNSGSQLEGFGYDIGCRLLAEVLHVPETQQQQQQQQQQQRRRQRQQQKQPTQLSAGSEVGQAVGCYLLRSCLSLRGGSSSSRRHSRAEAGLRRCLLLGAAPRHMPP
jgi:hypothetical protein